MTKKDITEFSHLPFAETSFYENLFGDIDFCEQIVKNFNKSSCFVKESEIGFNKFIVIGTGGSALGAKTFISLSKSKSKFIFFDNLDVDYFYNTLRNINTEETGVLVISKSGETIEILTQFSLLIPNFKEHKSNILVLTDPSSSLGKIAINNGIKTHQLQENISGRFSAFTSSVLIPALLAKIDIKNIIKAAKFYLKNNVEESKISAETMFFYLKMGISKLVTWVYNSNLKNYNLWFSQLWAESLGKSGKNPMTPIPSFGTFDQHSLLQLYCGGPKDLAFRFIYTNDSLKCNIVDDNIKYFTIKNITKKTLQDVKYACFNATVDSIKEKNHPCEVISMENLNEESLSRLMMKNMMEVLFFAKLLEVNPFTQPDVEFGKKRALEYLDDENSTFIKK